MSNDPQPATPASAPEVSEEAEGLVDLLANVFNFEPRSETYTVVGARIQRAINAATASLRDELRRAEAELLSAHGRGYGDDAFIKVQEEKIAAVEAERDSLRTQLAECRAEFHHLAEIDAAYQQELIEVKEELAEAKAEVKHWQEGCNNWNDSYCELEKLLREAGAYNPEMDAREGDETPNALKGLIAQLTALQSQHDREGEAAKVEIVALRMTLDYVHANLKAHMRKESEVIATELARTSADYADKIVVSRAEWLSAKAGPHLTACNAQTGPIGCPGCICVVSNKNEIAALAEAEKDKARLDWLLDNSDIKSHTGGWPYPDTRGTYGRRFCGRIYFESCEGRPVQEFFKDRQAIDAALAQQASDKKSD